jgi:hypothetical protein
MVKLGALDLPQFPGRRPGRPKTHGLHPSAKLWVAHYRHDLLLETLDDL